MNLSSVRQAIASKVAALTGFQETTHSPDQFGRTQNTVAHRAFAVGMSSSSSMEERQRRAVGVYMNTPVEVIFSYRLRPLDIYPTDYDLALDTEQTVITGILGEYTTGTEFSIRYVNSVRAVTDSQEYIIITILFETLHTI